MKEGASLTMVILMAYPFLLACMVVIDFVLLLIAIFSGWWWLFVMGVIATAGFCAWHWWFMSRLEDEL